MDSRIFGGFSWVSRIFIGCPSPKHLMVRLLYPLGQGLETFSGLFVCGGSENEGNMLYIYILIGCFDCLFSSFVD